MDQYSRQFGKLILVRWVRWLRFAHPCIFSVIGFLPFNECHPPFASPPLPQYQTLIEDIRLNLEDDVGFLEEVGFWLWWFSFVLVCLSFLCSCVSSTLITMVLLARFGLASFVGTFPLFSPSPPLGHGLDRGEQPDLRRHQPARRPDPRAQLRHTRPGHQGTGRKKVPRAQGC